MSEYATYHKSECVLGEMNAVDSDRYAKTIHHANQHMADWVFFLSYMDESKVAYVKPIGRPDADGSVQCKVMEIPFR